MPRRLVIATILGGILVVVAGTVAVAALPTLLPDDEPTVAPIVLTPGDAGTASPAPIPTSTEPVAVAPAEPHDVGDDHGGATGGDDSGSDDSSDDSGGGSSGTGGGSGGGSDSSGSDGGGSDD